MSRVKALKQFVISGGMILKFPARRVQKAYADVCPNRWAYNFGLRSNPFLPQPRLLTAVIMKFNFEGGGGWTRASFGTTSTKLVFTTGCILIKTREFNYGLS